MFSHTAFMCTYQLELQLIFFLYLFTCSVPQSKLPAVVSTPTKHTSRHRECKALFSSCSDLNKWDLGHRWKVLRLICAEICLSDTKLASGAFAPSVHLSIWVGKTARGWKLLFFNWS